MAGSARKSTSEVLTVERVERALDKLAQMIVLMGDEGHCMLPLYERVESELDTMKAQMSKLSAVHLRVKQLKDRKEAQPS